MRLRVSDETGRRVSAPRVSRRFAGSRDAREAATRRAGIDSVTTVYAKLKETETLELDKKFRRLYFVCDPTCPKLRDALGICAPDHVKKFRRLDEGDTARPVLCRTCVCRKKWLYHCFAFFMFVFVPLGVLLPVWTQDRLKYHLDIDGPTGKTLWLVFTMLVASVWFVYLVYLQGQNMYAYYLRTYSPKAAAEREKHRRNDWWYKLLEQHAGCVVTVGLAPGVGPRPHEV